MSRKTPKTTAEPADIVVAIYRHSSAGLDYYHLLITTDSIVAGLSEGLPTLFDDLPDGPVVNRKTRYQLELKLKKAILEMRAGRISDVTIELPINGDMGKWGFHRKPVAADRDFDSLLTIGINRFGHLSEFRRRPSDVEMTVKSAVFGVEVAHVH